MLFTLNVFFNFLRASTFPFEILTGCDIFVTFYYFMLFVFKKLFIREAHANSLVGWTVAFWHRRVHVVACRHHRSPHRHNYDVISMPRPNQKVITVSATFYQDLQKVGKDREVSVPVLLKQALQSLRYGAYFAIAQDGTLQHQRRYFVEVSERGHRIIKLGCRIYSKPSPYMVERFLDAPLNLIPLDDPIRDKKARECREHLEAQVRQLTFQRQKASHEELMKEGIALIKDIDPEKGEDLEGILKDLKKGE